MFWGKVLAETNDYLVAYALVPAYGFPTKKYFYCTSGDFTLVQMPPLSEEFSKMASAISIPFRGEPSLPLMADGSAAAADEEPAEGEEEAPPPERFREMHRLAFTVSQIDHDVSVLPRGAFVVDASHNVIQNKSYGGLGYEAAGALDNYYHFRSPESAKAMAALAKPGLVRPSDFMDPCSDDSPKGCWALAYDTSATAVALRSLYWPGYFFFHLIDTPEYGGAYFGDGLPNLDIAFML
jgi:radial spoke head protein 9